MATLPEGPAHRQAQISTLTLPHRFVLLGSRSAPGGVSERTQWVQANGRLVGASAYGGRGNQQLYDWAVPASGDTTAVANTETQS